MKKVLVIGCNSFSASSFINYLLNKKYIVIGVSRSHQKKSCYCIHNKKDENFRFRKLDINKDIKKIIQIIKKNNIKFVINYASQSMVAESWLYPQDWFKTNSFSIPYFYNELSKIKNIRLVHISTPEVYGNTKNKVKEDQNFNPSTPYAVSRCTADTFLKILSKQKKINFVSVRAANVYGEGQDGYRIIPKTIINLNKNIPIELHGGGNSTRSFIHISDVSEATFKVMLKGKNGETYHVSNESYITIKNLVKLICKKLKVPFEKNIKFAKERVGKDYFYKLDTSKLKNELNWTPKIKLNDGIIKMINWYNKNYKQIDLKDTKYKHKK